MSIEKILQELWERKITPQEAYKALKGFPFEDLGFAKIDYHRSLRKGFPEVVYCPGKDREHLLAILVDLAEHVPNFVATRADRETFEFLKTHLPFLSFNPTARLIFAEREPLPRVGKIVVVTAGTADIPVAEEAACVAEIAGNFVERLFDVGVAGIHRLLARLSVFENANVVVVVAGMEGALPSVIAGLVGVPVIAVPTSIGYGAHFSGLAPLLAMLSSCVPGMAVVNIDNGFGAGFFAHLVNQLVERGKGGAGTLS
ncbi:MAG: nickel pincer cofactor biosynthesis protein LarB [Candidatus Caldatribacterium sp.]|uniref:nickel pincer cofactor biosynthesis protein LarB n=1 Tax=Candidatus Caldatribacterium sp. TaxID=2282143 RepID=UPI00299A3B80|nr:nickel pincer cofactor biosynthesis protein LarB [Candidatus Caldatribacterium sp.]MCX7729610.1 nickel pincer cofactor biosynthesis protein LarB [Candidatus Caldatribacterium sp.]MDW8081380.1 nickel pincer cofactor biosynthesis protein LarB [Candidatus Calescibacterium sp.]